ncbi:MAG: CBS domain-containing protein [Kouleothrix sp.]
MAVQGRTAADVMTSPVVSCNPEHQLPGNSPMMAHKIKRLPVVDADGRLIGWSGARVCSPRLATMLPRHCPLKATHRRICKPGVPGSQPE